MIKINYEFYKNDNDYNKDIYNEYVDDIEKYINNYKRDEYEKILVDDKRTNIINIFSSIRENIIKWYPFEENKKVLEIGANYGEITGTLLKQKLKVTSLEFSKKKAELIAKRYEEQENLNIICGNLKDIQFTEKYDYITIFGVAEYAKKIGFNDIFDMLKYIQNLLSENGKILISLDNKFAVKYLAGSTRNKDEVPFANYKEYVEKDYELYGKYEIEENLKEIGLNEYKFYYPVPDYKLAHLIYTDNYMPKANSNKISYNIYYREDEEILFNEISFINQVIKNNKFDFFANSYLIEIGTKVNTNFIKFTNMRKEEYSIITKIDEGKVFKLPNTEKAINHINTIGKNIERLKELGFETCDNLAENKIESNYIEYQTFDKYVVDILEKNHDIETFKQTINTWFEYIESKLEKTNNKDDFFKKYEIEIDEEQKNKMIFVKDGFIDLVFQNIFFNGEKYIVFDQEWYEENIPIEFIKYRTIEQLYFYNPQIKDYIKKEEIYEILGITPYIEIFGKLEEKWQQNMVNNEILEFYNQKCKRIISIEDIKFQYNQELGDLYQKKYEINEDLEKAKKRILELEEEKKQILEDKNILAKIFNRGRK
jgi:2-polyprenyl-3-methyl-5-hydroxy-6-metoxy-1,4-benzoquinol methylase